MVGRLGRPLGRFEFEFALPVVARIGIEDHRRRAQSVAGRAVAMAAVAPIQAGLVAELVAAHRTGGQLESCSGPARVGQHEGLVGRAEHGVRMLAISCCCGTGICLAAISTMFR